jgi:hypothetical protein
LPANAPLDFSLHYQQGIAFRSEATEILYGGAAGGGKSHLLRVAAVTWCAQFDGLQCYLFRRISEDLVKNHIEGPKGLRAMLAPWVLGGLATIVEDEIRFWNDSKIYLCHCKDEKDRFKYLGAEIHLLLIDELTTFTEVIYRFLRSRVRAVGLNLPDTYRERFPRIIAGSNPGNVGHHWVKAAFIDNVQPLVLREMEDSEGGMRRQYIPARLQHNPSMATDDPKYRSRLRGLGSPALVKAMEDGDWNVVAGAFFPEFSTEQHVIRPFEVPKHWVRFRAMDWGSAKPFSVGWFAVSDGEMSEYPRGALVQYREWYGMQPGQPNVGLKLTAEQVADGILEREAEGEKIDMSVIDPAAFSEDGGPSIAERMSKRGVYFQRADNSRIGKRGAMGGWDMLRARLVGEDDKPMLYVFDTCVHIIRTLPALQHDDARPEDANSSGEDHGPDQLRYAVMARPWIREQPKPKPVRFDKSTQLTINEIIAQRRRARLGAE